MEAQKDFKELLALFNALHVRYIIVGGYALAFHGAPRMTGDIDIFFEPSEDNSFRIIEALKEFGFGNIGLKSEDFTQRDNVIQLGQPPVRIDILTSLTGVSWKKAYTTKQKGKYGELGIFFN
ncbi:MAG: nucleotidyl transferase AbiEii/AbiGii toxin family protein [Candidatus Omnitrophica bacterium]|nr:nucleotidyl transferase AbiEii/AbiGii toxin family protein [Candidatus Omnitrophota bacterium]